MRNIQVTAQHEFPFCPELLEVRVELGEKAELGRLSLFA